jgi:hypothetical protein
MNEIESAVGDLKGARTLCSYAMDKLLSDPRYQRQRSEVRHCYTQLGRAIEDIEKRLEDQENDAGLVEPT